MAKIDFNMKTLEHYQNSADDMEADLAKTCLDDFREYGKIVVTFDDKIKSWKENKSADEYRELVGSQDRKRRMIHNNCLNDINIINRMAKADGLKPFVIADSTSANRTDYGNAIIEQCYENIQKNEASIVPTKSKTKSKTAEHRKVMDDYNYMLDGFTKYPMVSNQGKLGFIDMFTQKPVKYEQVQKYVAGRTSDKSKLDLLTKAQNLIKDSIKEINFPKLDTSKIKQPETGLQFE